MFWDRQKRDAVLAHNHLRALDGSDLSLHGQEIVGRP
jgi:hypothetical protein